MSDARSEPGVDAWPISGRVPALAIARMSSTYGRDTPGCFCSGEPDVSSGRAGPAFVRPYRAYEDVKVPLDVVARLNVKWGADLQSLPPPRPEMSAEIAAPGGDHEDQSRRLVLFFDSPIIDICTAAFGDLSASVTLHRLGSGTREKAAKGAPRDGGIMVAFGYKHLDGKSRAPII